jgi:tetratricopeptide (TPR) repeat protein
VAAGRDFEFDVVARAAGLSESAGLDALDELRAARLIGPSREDASGRRYCFDHTLTMVVASRDVGELRHRLMHRRVAEAYEALYRDRADSLAGVLAWHFAEGNAPERASAYAFRAGQQSARLAAWREAAALFEQALSGAAEEQRAVILMELGEAHFRIGQAAQSSEAYRQALNLARAQGDEAMAADAQMALGRALIIQARYAEAIELARQICASRQPAQAAHAELLWGTALSLEGADLTGAAEHLQRAAEMMPADSPWLPQVKFELAGVAAQRGDLPRAIELYRELLTSAPPWNALAHNNLAYHLHLLSDSSAGEYAQRGLRLAHELGLPTLLPFLHSTLGEIALAAGEAAAAEVQFTEGLRLAEQFTLPERIAGLTANLGLAAKARGETALAIHRLSTALAQADALGTRHLSAQIRLWLAPLLPPAEARHRLAEARALAEQGGRQRLLAEAARLEQARP